MCYLASVSRHFALSPRVRRLAAALVLGVGVYWVGHTLVDVTPREVTVQVRLGLFRETPHIARSITVVFSRDGEPVRELSERFDRVPPVVWQRPLSIPPGTYSASVTVELQGRSAERAQSVSVHPGDTVELVAPQPP